MASLPSSSATAAEQRRPDRWHVLRAAALRIDEERALERFSELKTALPSRAARRMSRLGLMLTHLLEQTGVDEETTVIYASSFGEGRTLETYLDSFPQPSPLGFQSSIHPAGAEQGLIFRQQPVREFFPLAGRRHLPLTMLQQLRLCPPSHKVLLMGGEEASIWLKDYSLAAASSFAFALLLEAATGRSGNPAERPEPPVGTLHLLQPPLSAEELHSSNASEGGNNSTEREDSTEQENSSEQEDSPSLDAFCAAIDNRSEQHLYHPHWGSWLLSWTGKEQS